MTFTANENRAGTGLRVSASSTSRTSTYSVLSAGAAATTEGSTPHRKHPATATAAIAILNGSHLEEWIIRGLWWVEIELPAQEEDSNPVVVKVAEARVFAFGENVTAETTAE